jgi:hypothetical protein
MTKAKSSKEPEAPKKTTSKEVESSMSKEEAQAIVNKYNSLGKGAGEPGELIEARKVLGS